MPVLAVVEATAAGTIAGASGASMMTVLVLMEMQVTRLLDLPASNGFRACPRDARWSSGVHNADTGALNSADRMG